MLSRISFGGVALAVLAAWASAQEQPDASTPEGKGKQPAVDSASKRDSGRVVKAGSKKEKIRVLKPKDVAAELVRLKTKADIKAEITVRTSSGRPVTFKGVIRNGKLIERIIKRRFVPQRSLVDAHCGVRIWWSGGTDGFIFFRYSVIKTLAITGRLTDAERRDIMRRLKDKREGKNPDGVSQPAPDAAQHLTKLSPQELKAYLVSRYPYDKGWDHKRMRALKRKKLIDNKVLAPEEEIFVKYFPILVEAHFEDLKKKTNKIEIEPDSGSDSPQDTGSPDEDAGGGGR